MLVCSTSAAYMKGLHGCAFCPLMPLPGISPCRHTFTFLIDCQPIKLCTLSLSLHVHIVALCFVPVQHYCTVGKAFASLSERIAQFVLSYVKEANSEAMAFLKSKLAMWR